MGTETKRFAVAVAASDFPALREGAERRLITRARDENYTIFGTPAWEAPRAHDKVQTWWVSVKGYRPTAQPDEPSRRIDMRLPEVELYTGGTQNATDTTTPE